MTSANLSLGEKIKNRRTYLNRTLWTSLVVTPFYAAYFILGVIMMVSRSINYANVYHQTAEQLRMEKISAVANIVGFGSIAWILVVGTAVMFALQGFSYVFNVSQMDFYLSQPTTRAQRIKKNYLNAFGTFISIYVLTEAVALIIAAAMGAVNGNVLMSALIETVRSIILFFAFYNMTVLAVMLSGSLPIAILVTAGFTFLSVIIFGEIALFKGIFYSTFYGEEPFRVYLSPIYDRISAMSHLITVTKDDLLKAGYITKCIDCIIDKEIDILIVGALAFVAVLIFAKLRQAEMAGKSIPFRPFRWFIKVISCAIVGVGSGYFVYLVYSSVWNAKLYVMMCAIMVIATIFAGCIIEVILEGNIRRMFKGMAQTIMAIALVILTFVIYKGDLLGFDSFVPSAEKVESCAILNGERTFNFYNGFYSESRFSSNEFMKLTDVESFIELAKVGMETQKKTKDSENRGLYINSGYQVGILYRMKNGKDIYRYITIPYDTVDDSLDRIVSSKEYKIGNFEVFQDDYIRENSLLASNSTLRYVTPLESKDTKNFDYARFSDAYRQDILDHYSFKDMKDKMPIGSVEYEVNDGNYVYGSFDVYDTYSNTIALLKEYGIYSETTLTVDDIRKINVINYYPGYDLEQMEDGEYINIDAPQNKEMSYTDKDKMEEILGAVVSTDFWNPWYNYNNNNQQYSAQIYTNDDRSKYDTAYYTFLKGKVPDFVVKDTN
ncbi:MAG: hypothetical protein E7308_08750 [Butyrivibrio sp.]|nr:hypothetical protein [Butyrivibrio sp.]